MSANAKSKKPENPTLLISRKRWLRVHEDGSVPELGLKGPKAKDSIFMSVEQLGGLTMACALGFFALQIAGLPPEKILGKDLLSDVGVKTLSVEVASGHGDRVSMEEEITRLNDREGIYKKLSEAQIEAQMTGLFSSVGVQLIFK